MFSMHTAHLANVSKSVTKNATFSRTGGLPCLITHSCMSAASPTVVGGLIFCISATPQLGSLFPLFHDYIKVDFLQKLSSDPNTFNLNSTYIFYSGLDYSDQECECGLNYDKSRNQKPDRGGMKSEFPWQALIRFPK